MEFCYKTKHDFACCQSFPYNTIYDKDNKTRFKYQEIVEGGWTQSFSSYSSMNPYIRGFCYSTWIKNGIKYSRKQRASFYKETNCNFLI